MSDLGYYDRAQEIQIVSESTNKSARVEDASSLTDGDGLRVYNTTVDHSGALINPSNPLPVFIPGSSEAGKTALWDGVSSPNVAVNQDPDGQWRLAVDIRGQALDIAQYPIWNSIRYRKTGGGDETVFSVTADDTGGKDKFVTSITLGTEGNAGGLRFYNPSATPSEYITIGVAKEDTYQHSFSKAIRIRNGETFYLDLVGSMCTNNNWYRVAYDGLELKVE